jgi:hypothetical protein
VIKKLVICIALATAGLVGSLQAQQPSPVTRTILQRTDVPGTNLELIYATVQIARASRPAVTRIPGW